MGAETIIRSLLAADGGVTSLAGDRISQGTRAPGEALPAVTFHQVSGAALQECSGPANWIVAVYQVNCWGVGIVEATDLAAAVKTAFNVINQTVGSMTVDHIRILDEGDVSVLAAGNEALELKGKRLDIRITYKE